MGICALRCSLEQLSGRDLNSGLSWTMDCRERQSARLSVNSKMCLPVICLVLSGWEGSWPARLLIGMPSVIIMISLLQQPVPAFHCSLVPAWGVGRGRREEGVRGGGTKGTARRSDRSFSKSSGFFLAPRDEQAVPRPPPSPKAKP